MQPSCLQVLPTSGPSFPATGKVLPPPPGLPALTDVLSSSTGRLTGERTYLVGGLYFPFPPSSRRLRGPEGITERLGCPPKASWKMRHRTSPTGIKRNSWRQSPQFGRDLVTGLHFPSTASHT